MLNFSGKRNFHDTNTLLTVSVEGFDADRIKVWYETVSWPMRVDVSVLDCWMEERIVQVGTC